MQFSLALSGEIPPLDILKDFTGGVGLIRGEYILRDLGKYITRPEATNAITQYLVKIAELAYPKNVWYRSSDLESSEAVVLEGIEDFEIDPIPSMGRRGIRRSLQYGSSFQLELEAFKTAHSYYKNLNIIFPFVSDVEEARRAINLGREIIGECRFGSMLETPASAMIIPELVEMGYSHFLFGCNDMWSLTMAQPRIAGNYPLMSLPLSRLLKLVRKETSHHGVSLAVAGYLNEELIQMADEANVDNLVVHYSQLPKLFEGKYKDLPDSQKMKEIKTKSREAQKKYKMINP